MTGDGPGVAAELGKWSPRDWSLNLTVFHAGHIVGLQTIGARDLAVSREVHTGSWLGRRYQVGMPPSRLRRRRRLGPCLPMFGIDG